VINIDDIPYSLVEKYFAFRHIEHFEHTREVAFKKIEIYKASNTNITERIGVVEYWIL